MLQVFLYRLFAHYTRAPHTIAYRPEVLTPVALPQHRELLLQMMGCAAFQFLHQHAHTHLGRILHMHMDMVLANNTPQDPHILAVAYLYQDVPAALLNISCQNRIPVFRRPYKVTRQRTYCMTVMTII